MFLRYLEPIFKPWRMMRNKIQKVRTVKGNLVAEKNRVARFGKVAQNKVGAVKGQAGKVQGQAQQAQAGVAGAQGRVSGMMPQQPGMMPPPQGMMPQQPGMMPPQPGMMPPQPGMPGMPPHMQGAQAMQNNMGAPGAFNPNPPIRTVGWFRKRKFCTQCEQQLDPTWDSCPYCAQQAQQMAQPAPGPQKTRAFMIDPSGGGSVQLLGWIVPLQGAQRGELFTLAPASVIGTDPTCNVVLNDHFMSSRHAEIRAEGGTWILRDLGSTNGTFVNDKRVEQHELIDNDFVKFGKSVVKFKSL